VRKEKRAARGGGRRKLEMIGKRGFLRNEKRKKAEIKNLGGI